MICDPRNTHLMVTHHVVGITKHVDHLPLLPLHQHCLTPHPLSVPHSSTPHQRRTIAEEYETLLFNNTWDLVLRPPRANLVIDMLIFKHKFKADGSLDRYKACWVLWGFTQYLGVDYDETFSPVMKPMIVRTLLILAISKGMHVHQLDVKNTFLHDTLIKTVCCYQPTSFVDPAHPQLVCRLNKSL
jgi:hypothetical protein